MTTKQINDSVSYVSQQIRKFAAHSGQIIMKSTALTDGLIKNVLLSQRESNFIANLLIFNGLITLDGIFLKLTERGYSYFNEDSSGFFMINFLRCLPLTGQNQQQQFYILWDIIGLDKDTNPYYVDGKMFYNEIRRYINALPPTYSQYTKSLHESGQSTSRSEWCKNLFMQLPINEVNPFLESLSERINQKMSTTVDENNISLEVTERVHVIREDDKKNPVEADYKMDRKEKSPKIFISHNSKDCEYAKDFVRLLRDLGVNDGRDIFCSSVPGCGVEFGQSFIDAIRSQYEDHNLIMLYIHSPRYYESHVSLCEMGASWIMRHDHRSFLTSDCDFGMLDAVIPPTETAFKAGQENTYHLLNDFKQFVEGIFGLSPKNFSLWEEYKNTFITSTSVKNVKS